MVIPDLPFGGPQQADPGFVAGMQQSIASPFSPAPTPANVSKTPIPPAAATPASNGGGFLDKLLPVAGLMLMSMSPNTRGMIPAFMQMEQTKRKQAGLQESAKAMSAVGQALQAGDVDAADQVIAQVMPKIQPEHATMLKGMMDKIDATRQNQNFTSGLMPALDASGASERPEIKAIAPALKNLPPDKQLDLLKQFGLTPHIHEGVVFFTNPLSGPASVAPQPLPTAAKPEQYTKFQQAILAAGYPSVADFVNQINTGNSQAIAMASQLVQKQFQIEKGQAGELAKQQSDITEGREKRLIGARSASDIAEFKALMPERLLLAQQQGAAAAEVKPLEAGQQEKLDTYLQAEGLTTQLKREFTPEERRKYVGLLGTKMTKGNIEAALADAMGQKADPKFARFGALLNTFKATQAYALGGKTLPGNEQSVIFGMIPTGGEWSSDQFEEKLNLSHEMARGRIDNMMGLSGPRKNVPEYINRARQNYGNMPLSDTPIKSETPSTSTPPSTGIELAPGLRLRKKGQ